MKEYLLDSIVKSPLPQEVIEAMLPYFQHHVGSPAFNHKKAIELYPFLRLALKAIYRLIDAPVEAPFIFTSSGAEAINQVIFATYLDVTRKSGKNHFLTAATAEAPAILTMSRLKELGCHFEMIPTNEAGVVTKEAVIEAITPRTALISLSLVNALTGVVQPLKEIGAIIKERNIALHLDISHILGKMPLTFSELLGFGADFITFNGDQIQAPPATGGLFLQPDSTIQPLILGGNEQIFRGGSFNLPYFMGLAKAAELAFDRVDFFPLEVSSLRNFFEQELTKKIPGASVLFKETPRVPHISALHFPKVHGEHLAFLLQRKNLFASLGGGHFQKLHYILEAAGKSSDSALSFSLSNSLQKADLAEAISLIVETYHLARRVHV